ncbi:B-cell linker protein-like isoform X2 [Octopus sinensis]|uniref:B-cell linker protein-like isoform X2 n=1 Tax=Octopus sinensis TaxID=2607531 RepID=A0A7E6FKL6_9MOLL|nr:B-cell linker protein-like isoform X2 [Octopus sinensis]
MSYNQSIYQDMSLENGPDGSSDDGWSDDHFSEVDSSGNELDYDYPTQRYLELNELKYPEKLSTSPALSPQKLSTSPALPPRNNIIPPPIPPIRKKDSQHITREQNKFSSEANSRQFSKDPNKAPESLSQAFSKLRPVATSCKEDDEGNYIVPPPIPPSRSKKSAHKPREQKKFTSEANSRQFSKDPNKAPESLSQAFSKLRPVATSCKEDDEGNYIVPPPIPPSRSKKSAHKPREQKKFTSEANSRKFSKDPNKGPENLSQAMSKLRPVTPGKKDEVDYVLPVNSSRKPNKENTKIVEGLALALSKLKPVAHGSDEEDGDYVVPVNKSTWQQSKNSLISPMTQKEMSKRKKLPIPPLFNTPNDAESLHQQDPLAFEWFHSRSNREVIKEQLLQHEMDGMFAVRKSNQKSSFHSYSLTFYHRGQIYNFPIRTRVSDKKFALGYEKPNEPAFSSLEKLVAYFNENKIKLANNDLAILTKPLPKFS